MYYAKTEAKRHACYKCGEELVLEVKVGRRDMCPNCSAYLHSCFNCKHHDKNVHNECLENQGEFIRDRSEGNFCVYFEFRPMAGTTSPTDDAKKKLEALFGGAPAAPAAKPTLDFTGTPKTETDAKARLDALFKK